MQEKYGLLLIQLGTPEAPTKRALKSYLRQFLSDPRVVDIEPLFWQIILNFFVLRDRPEKSAELYKEIWTEKGSPLKEMTEAQTDFFKPFVQQNVEVTYAMRYGEPSIRQRMIEFKIKGITNIYVVPLYPQYSSSTTGSVLEELMERIKKFRWVPHLKVLQPFYHRPFYLNALAQNILSAYQKTPFKTLVVSYHGIPKSYAEMGDPYEEMCLETTRLLRETLGQIKFEIVHAYQSRFGKEEWLKPYTDDVLKTLDSDVAIISPAFVADCLETLHELNVELRGVFEENGGKNFQFIPCLNTTPEWLIGLKDLIEEDQGTWKLIKGTSKN